MHHHNTKRVVIKIGSSSLTSRQGEMNKKKIQKIVEDVALIKDEGYEVLIVSSGAVAAGYRKLGCLSRPTDLAQKQAAAAIGQGQLIRTYSDLLLSHGYVGAQILITRSDFSESERKQNIINTLQVLLDRGIIPIINENDTVALNEMVFGDNDTLSARVACLIQADLLILLSDIDGLYNANPIDHPEAVLVEEVKEITLEMEEGAGGPGSSVGSGGMKSKLEAVKIAKAQGIPTFLGRASLPNIAYDAIHHKAKGTYFYYNQLIKG